MRWQTVAWLVGFACCVVAFAPQYSVDAKDTHRVSNNVFDELATGPQTECLVALYVEVNWSAGHAVHHHTFELRSIASSSYDFTLTWSRSAGGSRHFYVFDLRSDASSSGDFTSSVSVDDLSVTYAESTWSDGSSNYYLFEAHKSATQSGTYNKQSTVNDDVSPAAMTNLPEGWYKVRGRRCVDSSRTECGAWSALTSSAVQITQSAPPPTALTLTLSGDNDLELTYTQSSWTGQTTHFYEFELLRSETSSGTYGEYEDDDDRASPLDFDDVHTGYYYRARGKRCASAGTSCGGWSTLSPQLNVPAKTTYTAPTLSTPTVSGDADDMTVAFSKSTVSALRTHHYVIDLHRADSASGTFASNKTASAASSPVTFEGIDRSKVYKARGKRCDPDEENVCGPWSAFSSVWDAPSPPSGVTLNLTRPNTLSATYTRSTVPAASTHRYQFKLVRSESAGGTYVDYGNIVNTTSTVSFRTVHTGYHYKAVGRRCRTASTDCGEWSVQSASSNVPAADYTPPPLQKPTLANFDEVSVQFDRATGTRAPPTQYHVVQLTKSDSSTGTHVGYTSDTPAAPPSVKFSDVATSAYYKAKAKTCTDMNRKLCGAWSSPTDQLTVPEPTFPALTAPTIAAGASGTINATVTLPSSSYTYLLTLSWSDTGKDYSELPAPAFLSRPETKHSFSGLQPSNGGYYLAELSACVDAARTNCGNPVSSNVTTLPKLQVSPSGDTWRGPGSTVTFSATARDVLSSHAYSLRFSVTGASRGVLRFDDCDPDTDATAMTVKSVSVTSNARSTVDHTSIELNACREGNPEVVIDLMTGTDVVASAKRTVRILGPPGGIRANGDNGGEGGAKIAVRWDSVPSTTSYEIQYSLSHDPSGDKIADDRLHWNDPVLTSAAASKTFNVTVLRRVYQVQVRSVRDRVKSAWSESVYVMPTNVRPTFGTENEPEFANIPMTGYWDSSIYTYNLCADRFEEPDAASAPLWMNDIRAAINRVVDNVDWQLANGRNIIAASDAVDDNCTTEEIKWGSSHNAIFLAKTLREFEMYCGTSSNPSDIINGCAASTGTNGRKSSSHIVLRPANLKTDWNPNNPAPNSDRCSNLFSTTLHEAGHAFGLDHTNPVTGVKDNEVSMMVSPSSGKICHPTVYDIGAIMTIYQSHTPSVSGVP